MASRLGDLRRLKIPLTPATGTVFPGGGGNCGAQVCFPLLDVERNNKVGFDQ